MKVVRSNVRLQLEKVDLVWSRHAVDGWSRREVAFADLDRERRKWEGKQA